MLVNRSQCLQLLESAEILALRGRYFHCEPCWLARRRRRAGESQGGGNHPAACSSLALRTRPAPPRPRRCAVRLQMLQDPVALE